MSWRIDLDVHTGASSPAAEVIRAARVQEAIDELHVRLEEQRLRRSKILQPRAVATNSRLQQDVSETTEVLARSNRWRV